MAKNKMLDVSTVPLDDLSKKGYDLILEDKYGATFPARKFIKFANCNVTVDTEKYLIGQGFPLNPYNYGVIAGEESTAVVYVGTELGTDLERVWKEIRTTTLVESTGDVPYWTQGYKTIGVQSSGTAKYNISIMPDSTEPSCEFGFTCPDSYTVDWGGDAVIYGRFNNPSDTVEILRNNNPYLTFNAGAFNGTHIIKLKNLVEGDIIKLQHPSGYTTGGDFIVFGVYLTGTGDDPPNVVLYDDLRIALTIQYPYEEQSPYDWNEPWNSANMMLPARDTGNYPTVRQSTYYYIDTQTVSSAGGLQCVLSGSDRGSVCSWKRTMYFWFALINDNSRNDNILMWSDDEMGHSVWFNKTDLYVKGFNSGAVKYRAVLPEYGYTQTLIIQDDYDNGGNGGPDLVRKIYMNGSLIVDEVISTGIVDFAGGVAVSPFHLLGDGTSKIMKAGLWRYQLWDSIRPYNQIPIAP